MIQSLRHFALRGLLCLLSASPSMLFARDTEKPKRASSADEAAELAKKLANPVASLISVPFLK